jgi:UDP-glucose 4-epimerase
MKPQILVTGGAGYIGSHTIVALLAAGYDILIVDNFCNSQPSVLHRLEQITASSIKNLEGDVCDIEFLRQCFAKNSIHAVIHFAALKSVGESFEKPQEYYRNNVGGTKNLLNVMNEFKVHRLVFSSSATVYGDARTVPITEDAPRSATNPYGESKLVVETFLQDVSKHNPELRISMLRYFNPVGAHDSGLIGEDPRGTPNNLMPYIAQVAVGRRPKVTVFGSDYPTVDGTGVRDFIHVMDLAEGHVAALKYLDTQAGVTAVNLGTGRGYSVLEMIHTFERVSGAQIPFELGPRRNGDVAQSWADVSLAERLFGWRARRTLEDMCIDTWRWQKQNPTGYTGT